VPIKDTGKKPMDIDESADVPSQKPLIANDHEAGSSKSAADKYHQPRWCPSGLTHRQKRKLQRLRNKEKKEQEKKEESKPVADVEKLKAAAVVQIGDMKVAIKDAGKELMVIEKPVDVPMQRPVKANDHEAGSSKSVADKYHQPRWCPLCLTHTKEEVVAPS